MTANDFLSAICGKLQGLWPDKTAQTVPVAGSGFYVRCTGQSQNRELGGRQGLIYHFEVQNIVQDGSAEEQNSWADTMVREFQDLEVLGRLFHLTGQRAEQGEDKVFRFTCSVSFKAAKPPDTGAVMENMTQQTRA